MTRKDARKRDHATLEAIRLRAVQQVQGGESPELVIGVLGVSSRCTYNWLAMYRSWGWDAADTGPCDEAERARHPLGVSDGNGTQSGAAELCVCAVDALDECQADS